MMKTITILALCFCLRMMPQALAIEPAETTLAATEPVATEPATTEPAATVDFDRQVRPILSEHCFTCHGPDANMLKAGLRLDRQASVLQPADSGKAAVVPGQSQASELVRRITSGDADEKMPPADSPKPLTADQIEVLRRWVDEGAHWSEHWSFKPIERPAVPAVAPVTAAEPAAVPPAVPAAAPGDLASPSSTKLPPATPAPGINAIDAFIDARLEKDGLRRSPEETKERLIRRASLDLIGLPPSLQEVRNFLDDQDDRAFEKVVDRLLSSEHFGERLAIQWLDLARYGDTSGYHNDSLRNMWLWREWVIRAFNANMPFDQFTIEQIAGDLLPESTVQQKVASGFHRNHMTSDEGGLIDAEYRNLYVVDRVGTTGVAWLGMTVACAQCHDHKYDPVSQRDFYGIYAFFNNVPENGKDGVRDRNPVPFLRVMDEAQTAELQRRTDEVKGQTEQREALVQTLVTKQAAWEVEIAAAPVQPEPSGPRYRFSLDGNGEGNGDGTSGSSLAGTAQSGEKIAAAVHGVVAYIEGVQGQAAVFDGKNGLDYPELFNFEKDQSFTASAFLKLNPLGGSPLGRMESTADTRGWDIEFHGLRPSVHLIHRWPEECIHIQADQDLPAEKWMHLALTYDGSGKASGLMLYADGAPIKMSVKKDNLTGSIKTTAPFSIGRRGGLAAPFHGQIDDVRVYPRTLDRIEVATLGGAESFAIVKIPADMRTPEQKQQLEKFYRALFANELQELDARLAELKKSQAEFEAALPDTMVMSEMPTPRDTFMKVRGNYDQDGERVAPSVPSFLPQLAPRSDGKPFDRLDFARWLVSSEHPLTARVTINRLWSIFMGNGIVKTLNDFGAQGERPSHPELLDWLAADFLSDWDVKRAIKQIVLSATYRQQSATTPEMLSRDSENRLLARGPRQRLDAELIRDNALAVAGILNPAIGGKSIKPAQPAGTWEINEMSGYSYDKSTGADLYRRGLYVYWRRSTVYPSFVTLDAPTREFCISQRAKTSTPLQSLVLMNDPVFVEAARALAQRILTSEVLDSDQRLKHLWKLALAREPSVEELAILRRTLQTQQATYTQNKEAAKQLSSVGDLARPANIDECELAAWTALSNVILNLNETISN